MVKHFEDLDCWKQARVLVNNIYSLSNKRDFKKDYGLKDQIRHASVSAMTNIAEGFARYSTKDFIRFLDFSQSSCAEVKSLLYVAFDQNYIDKKELKDNYEKASDIQNMTLGLIKYLRKKL